MDLGVVMVDLMSKQFVQIAMNPIDWDSELVQAGPCYEVIRKHGRKVIIMEAVKGGRLARLPEDAEAVLKERKSPGSDRHIRIR